MTLREVLDTIGKGQGIIVRDLIARAYHEGMKQGEKETKKAAFKEGYTAGVKKAIEESPAYQAGLTDGIAFANGLLSSCFWLVLHREFGFGRVRIERLNKHLLHMYDTTLHPADLREQLKEIGIAADYYDVFSE